MNIATKKMNFIREFMRISDESLIDKLEDFLKSERKKQVQKEITSISMDAFLEMIEKSEDDASKGKVTEGREVLNQIEKWK